MNSKTTMSHASHCLIMAMALILSACSSSSDSSSDDGNNPGEGGGDTAENVTIEGTAATGAALDGTVSVKNANGTETEGTVGPNGGFMVQIPMAPPFILEGRPSASGEASLFSVVSEQEVLAPDRNGPIHVNVTPLTDAAVKSAAASFRGVFDDWPETPARNRLTSDNLRESAEKLRNNLASVFEENEVANPEAIDLSDVETRLESFLENKLNSEAFNRSELASQPPVSTSDSRLLVDELGLQNLENAGQVDAQVTFQQLEVDVRPVPEEAGTLEDTGDQFIAELSLEVRPDNADGDVSSIQIRFNWELTGFDEDTGSSGV